MKTDVIALVRRSLGERGRRGELGEGDTAIPGACKGGDFHQGGYGVHREILIKNRVK